MSDRRVANKNECFIYGVGAISALGAGVPQSFAALGSAKSSLSVRAFGEEKLAVGALSLDADETLAQFIVENQRYADLDRCVQLAMVASREAIGQAGWHGESDVGIAIGSSRGATGVLERAHRTYLESGKVPVATSPLTTLGNISSWVAQDLLTSGPAVSHSVTCSTALHTLATALAWIRAGMAQRFLVGGSEACLTGFTLAQMRALRIYTAIHDDDFPCRPCAEFGTNRAANTFVLGEGACILALGGAESGRAPLARIESFGCAVEAVASSTAISEEGLGLRQAMRRALDEMRDSSPIDMVVLHSPGTIKGDQAELTAIEAVFGEERPMLSSPKWLFGHTFGASGALGILHALYCLTNSACPPYPYPSRIKNVTRPVKKVMVNAAGFGGNAACVVLSLP